MRCCALTHSVPPFACVHSLVCACVQEAARNAYYARADEDAALRTQFRTELVCSSAAPARAGTSSCGSCPLRATVHCPGDWCARGQQMWLVCSACNCAYARVLVHATRCCLLVTLASACACVRVRVRACVCAQSTVELDLNRHLLGTNDETYLMALKMIK